jgi:hypothetical protein
LLLKEACTQPTSVLVDATSNTAFVSCTDTVLAVNPEDATFVTLADNNNCARAYNLAPPTASSSNLLAPCYNGAALLALSTPLQTPTRIGTCTTPSWVARSPTSNFHFVACAPQSGPVYDVSRIAPTGEETLVWNATNCSPTDIVLADSLDRIYVRCGNGGFHGWVSASARASASTVLTTIPLPQAGFDRCFPISQAWDSFHSRLLVVGSEYQAGLYASDPTGSQLSLLQLNNEQCIGRVVVPDAATGTIYLTCSIDSKNASLIAIHPSTGAVEVLLTQSECMAPTSAARLPSGRVLVTCSIDFRAGLPTLVSAPRASWDNGASGASTGSNTGSGGSTGADDDDSTGTNNAAASTKGARFALLTAVALAGFTFTR